MTNPKESIEKLFHSFSNEKISSIDKLPQSGGDRIYFRLTTESSASYIVTFSDNLKENNTFLYFTDQFSKINAPVPKIYAVNDERTIYIQEDFGNDSLLSVLEKEEFTDHVKSLYKKSLKALAALQIKADQSVDYNQCITAKEFGRQAILSDLLYFKYYFLDTLKLPYDKEKLGQELDTLSDFLAHANKKCFMFRDFQGRNVMIKNDEVFFIDYQGGMKGALQYDAASLLWQAKANLSDDWKNEFFQYYTDCVEAELNEKIDRNKFQQEYNGYVLIRLLQVLGAYGFRGLFERKAHFLTSIPLALNNLRSFLSHNSTGLDTPEFDRILGIITTDEIIHRFEPIHADEKTPLTVRIKSFSFLKTGYPKAIEANGGGFVFDCRGILNPGRIEDYKIQTGRDKPVQDYLTEKTRMDEFLSGVFGVVDISVEDYIKRNFESLEVNFGCTGGQHRSVYAADALARHLRNKYGVRTEVKHVEQNFQD